MDTHPVADLFPLMSDDELKALADDIGENGLRHPIVRDDQGRIIDGRNRFRACEIAAVEPQFIESNGGDPLALVVSLNIKRRNLTTSQRAIAAASAWELVGEGTRADPRARKCARLFGIGSTYVTQARGLVERAPDLAALVKSGAQSLGEADVERKKRDKATQEREAEAEALRRLESENADLAEAVDAGRMNFTEATEELKRRERRGKLPPDLAERVDEGMDLAEAEAVAQEREERLEVWAKEVSRAISVLAGLAGHDVPAGLVDKLDASEQGTLDLLLAGVPKEEES